MGAWIALQLEQPGSNRDAIGSWIEVKTGNQTMERELTVGGGHAGGQLGWIHFGLGNEDEARDPGAMARRREGTVDDSGCESVRLDRSRRLRGSPMASRLRLMRR